MNTVYGKESLVIYYNSARMIQLMLYGTQYVTQVSLNYILVYILKLVYIYIYIYTNLRFRCIYININLSAPLMYGFTIMYIYTHTNLWLGVYRYVCKYMYYTIVM